MHDTGYRFAVRDRVFYRDVEYAVAQRRSEEHKEHNKRDLIKVYYLLPVDEVESFSDGYLDKTNFHEWRPDRITRALQDDLTTR